MIQITKNFSFGIYSVFLSIFLINCATSAYTNSHSSLDANKYMYMSNEYYEAAEGKFRKLVSEDGSKTTLQSNNILLSPPDSGNWIGSRILNLEMEGEQLKVWDNISNEAITDKSNVLYFPGFDISRLNPKCVIEQKESSPESDLVDISRDPTIFSALAKNDKIKVNLNSKNAYKYSYDSLDVYQILLANETIVFHWKLKKISGVHQYIVEDSKKYSGISSIKSLYRSKMKYIGSKTLYYAGYTGVVFVDIITFPFQIPYLLLSLFAASHGAR